MRLLQVQAPQSLPVTLTEVKDAARIDTDASDDDLYRLIEAATKLMDGPTGITGVALMPQTWSLYLDGFPSPERIRIPLQPVISVTSVEYLDSSGNLQTLSASSYDVIDSDTIVAAIGTSWPGTYPDREDAVRITFDCGYRSETSPEQNAVPENIRHGIIATVAHWYDGGEGIPKVALDVIAPVRKGRLGYVV